MQTLTKDQRELLSTYLDDHWAGAGGGAELAQRLAANNADTAWATRLAGLAREVQEDEATLTEVREALGCDGGGAKRLLAVVGEKVARLKPNRRASSYSPLSRLLELEAMMAGVAGKHRLWEATVNSQVHQLPQLTRFDFARLLTRATDQLALLDEAHRDAAAVAFGAAEPVVGRPSLVLDGPNP